MQCSLGSRSGTSGVELWWSGRSWASDAISLAWRVAGAALASASFITLLANHSPHHTASTSTLTLPCIPPKPSSVSFTRSTGCCLSVHRLIISNIAEAMLQAVARRLTAQQHWDNISRPSLRLSARLLLQECQTIRC